MERYRFILKSAYGMGTDYVCAFLPENIQGLKLTKKLSLQIPIGYSVTASVDTIRLIGKDADILRENFNQNGINAYQACELQYLNEIGNGYDTVFVAEIDFVSIELTNSYVETGLIVNDAQKTWKEKSKVDISITPENRLVQFPQMYLPEYISGSGSAPSVTSGDVAITLKNKNTEKIYSNKIIAFSDEVQGENNFITFEEKPSVSPPKEVKIELLLKYKYEDSVTTPLKLKLKVVYHRYDSDGKKLFLTEYVDTGMQLTASKEDVKGDAVIPIRTMGGSGTRTHKYTTTVIPYFLNEENVATSFIAIKELTAQFFYDAQTPLFSAKTVSLYGILGTIFPKGYNFVKRQVDINAKISYGFLSGDMIAGYDDAILTINPARFLSDFCKILGYTYFFDRQGVVQLIPIESIISGASKVLGEVKNLSIKYCQDLLYSGTDIGYNSPSVNYPIGRQQFAEKLTYSTSRKGGDNILDLVSERIRIDYAGVLLQRLDYENAKKKGDEQKRYKDIWMIQEQSDSVPITPKISGQETNLEGGGVFNVNLSPRRMVGRWREYLQVIFSAWGNSSLQLSAQENVENKLISTLEWDENLTVYEKQPLVLIEYGDIPFIPVEATFETLQKIDDIHVLDIVSFSSAGKNYTGAIKEVSTTERLESLQVTVLLKNKII